jgi:hypothetical protein
MRPPVLGSRSDMESRTFVLVHGAWHGGWFYSRVRKILARQGHEVFTPTLPGLGEHAHLFSPAIKVPTCDRRYAQ